MTVRANLEAGFGDGGFSLDTAFAGLTTLFTDVSLPGLDLHLDVSLDVSGLGLDDISVVLHGTTGSLDAITGSLPDVGALLAPLPLALRLPELVAQVDLSTLADALSAAVAPQQPGLVAVVDAGRRLADVPEVGSLSELLRALGLDLAAPGHQLGGAAAGVVSALQILGGLLAAEAASRTLANRAALATDLLDVPRIAGTVARLRQTGGAQLAGLLTGIDPDDRALVEMIAPSIQTYLGLVTELQDALVRGLVLAQATLVDADVPALVGALTVASAAVATANPGPVRGLVASASPLVAPVVDLSVPAGGVEVVFGAVAQLQTRIEAAIDGLAPDTLAALVTPAVNPVLDAVRAVRRVLDELTAVIGVIFSPIEQALDAVDLTEVQRAIEAVTAPVVAAVDAVTTGITQAQSAVETAVRGVHDTLTPLRTTVTDAAGELMTPFAAVHDGLTALDLAGLQDQVRGTLQAVTAAISAAPVQPVFDVATGVVTTAADALALVPKALLPDDLRRELEAACAPVESLDLEPARAELHTQLAAMIDSIDASALDAVTAGFAEVTDFIDSIDPHPLVEQLETDAFTTLMEALNAIDPTEILAPVLESLATVRTAVAGLDLASAVRPLDDALDQVADTIAGLDPAELLSPVSGTIDEARETVRTALHLDDLAAVLTQVDTAVAAAIARVPVEATLAGIEAAWHDLLAGLRGDRGSAGSPPPGDVARALLAGLLPGVDVSGLPEVIDWIRGQRDGGEVVRGRLERAAADLGAAQQGLGTIDVSSLTVELTTAHRGLTEALGAHPADSLLVRTLSTPVLSTDPAPDLGRVIVNVDGVRAALAAAAQAVAPATAPDRSEIQRAADGLATAVIPLQPLVDKARELAVFVGLDPAQLAGPGGLGRAVAGLAERIGPDTLIGVLRSVATRLAARLAELVHVGLIGPVQGVVSELTELLAALSVEALLAEFTAVRTRLVGLVDQLRPSTVLAAPLAAFADLQQTLAAFDPLAPVRAVVDGLRAEITGFARDLAPSALLAPVLAAYDDIKATVGAFDVAGLLEPVLAALRAIGDLIDRGMDELIDALGRLKVACESEGGPIPGLDLSVAASVDVGGLL